ncbi:MAG: chromosome segregation protein SMC [Deltaproteobacteria bacterium RBG_13_49_15]|nr:MAG: chromosome segregation protein SMC [Deltaproteobacteria bacterium RBG_13_49_15]
MKLMKLEVFGFKSFLDKTSIVFPPGISAIVGPNGCGKSNIVDALRWVMGEQSVKQLRGKAMEDVIFSGANGRPPINMAEVSVILSNDNGSIPEEFKDFPEIMVTRRLHRSGDSNYFINKQPCRLKDIHNIFMGSGMGAKTYAVIQQGKISAITDAGPEERRMFIEEAAGISRFKSRKIEAMRKLEDSNQNLLRVLDILGEVKQQMEALKRQAKKAELSRKLQERARKLDVRISIDECAEFNRQIEKVDSLLQGLNDTHLEHMSKLQQLAAAAEEIKFKRLKKNEEIGHIKNDTFEVKRGIDKVENDITHMLKEMERLRDEILQLEGNQTELKGKNEQIISEIGLAKAESDKITFETEALKIALREKQGSSQQARDSLSQLQKDQERQKSHLMDLISREGRYRNVFESSSANKDNLKRRLVRIRSEKAATEKSISELIQKEADAKQQVALMLKEIGDLSDQIIRLERDLKEKRENLSRQVKHSQSVELKRNEIKTRFGTLKRMNDNYEWYKEGVRAVMKACSPETKDHPVVPPDAVFGLVADILEPKPEFESAVEAALGESLQHILVKDQDAGIRLIEYLRNSGAGRGGFIPMASIPRRSSETLVEKTPDGRLLDRIEVKNGFEAIAEALLGHVLVAETIQDAVILYNQYDSRQTVVTKEGDLISNQGIIIGGSKEKLTGILSKKVELKSLGNRIQELESQLLSSREEQKKMESETRDFESRLQQLIEKKNSLSRNHAEAEKTHYIVSEDLKHSRQHLNVINLEEEQLIGEESELDDEMIKFKNAMNALEKEMRNAKESLAGISEQINAASARMESSNQELVDIKLNLTGLSARLESGNNTLKRLSSFHEDGLRRLEELTHTIQSKTGRIEAIKQAKQEEEEKLGQLYQTVRRLEDIVRQSEDEYRTIEEHLKQNDGTISEVQGLRQNVLDQIKIMEFERAEQQMKRQSIIDRLMDRYQLSIETLQNEFSSDVQTPAGHLNESGPPARDFKEELLSLRKRIERIGDVNMGALVEYEQLQSRFEFLSAQRDDLLKAADDLHKVIQKINRVTKERFIKTFEMVNEKLKEVFPRLFEGGAAELVLTDPANILETGVEYLIYPPGKRVIRMSLLSGGEKALSAIALIFSIFLIKPASFCLMDEIDAPLDDLNVYRFNNLLKMIGEKSQVILITHNKKSMEFADTLFGITMEQKGISKIVSVNLEKAASAN